MSFVRSNENILEQPCWIIIINLVSLDFLRTSLAQQPGEWVEAETMLVIISLISAQSSH